MRNYISISTDRNLFKKESEVLKRQEGYAEHYDRYVVVVLTTRGYDKVRVRNIEIIPTNSLTKVLSIWSAYNAVRSIINESDSERWTVSTQDPFECGLAGFFATMATQALFHVQIHTDPFSSYFKSSSLLNWLRSIVAPFVIRRARMVRVVSGRVSKGVLALGVQEKNIQLKPIDINSEKIKSASVTHNLHTAYPHFDSIILMASRLSPEKNITFAINVFSDILKARPHAGLIIVGEGNERKRIERHIASLNLEGKVLLLGWKSGDELYSYYKTADVFLQTSLFEGYGMSLAEAVAAGCPAVSSDVGAARELISSDRIFPVNGRLVCRDIMLKILNKRDTL